MYAWIHGAGTVTEFSQMRKRSNPFAQEKWGDVARTCNYGDVDDDAWHKQST